MAILSVSWHKHLSSRPSRMCFIFSFTVPTNMWVYDGGWYHMHFVSLGFPSPCQKCPNCCNCSACWLRNVPYWMIWAPLSHPTNPHNFWVAIKKTIPLASECSYVCIYICVYTYIHTYINTYIHTYIHTYIQPHFTFFNVSQFFLVCIHDALNGQGFAMISLQSEFGGEPLVFTRPTWGDFEEIIHTSHHLQWHRGEARMFHPEGISMSIPTLLVNSGY